MHNLVLFCKSYRGDLDRIKILKDSIDKFNADSLPFFIVCPQEDIEYFKSTLKTGQENYPLEFITDETIVAKTGKLKQDWNSQQLVKLNFYKLNICRHFLIIDSDSYFIRPFFLSDFMYDNKTPYLIMYEAKDIKMLDSVTSFDNFDENIQKVMDKFNNRGKRYRYLNTPILFSCEPLKQMAEEYDFETLLKDVPSEAVWYGEFMRAKCKGKFIPCEPLFKCFNYQAEYTFWQNIGLQEEDIAKNYLGIVMQNGWLKDTSFKPSFWVKLHRKMRVVQNHLYQDVRYIKAMKKSRCARLLAKHYTVDLLKKIF